MQEMDGPYGEFWTGAESGQLLLPYCAHCDAFLWPPRGYCTTCGRRRGGWRPVPGMGTLFSWVEVHVTPSAALVGELPYVLGLIDVRDAGVRIPGPVRGAPQSLVVDTELRVDFEPFGALERVPVWRPAEG